MQADRYSEVIKKIFTVSLKDIQVDLGDEFDRNFDRSSFFSEKWQRRRQPDIRTNKLLVDSGELKNSIFSRIQGNEIRFYTDKPYAQIHNEGGEIIVTERMKRYFWYRSLTASDAFTRKKDGTLRSGGANIRRGSESDYFKALALMKVGSRIRIPRRRFIGYNRDVEKIVTGIIKECVTEYFNNINIKI